MDQADIPEPAIVENLCEFRRRIRKQGIFV